MLDVFRGLKNLIKVNYIHIDSPVFRLHYSITVILLISFSLIVTTRQYVGNPIDCIHTKDIPEDVLNTYCWIHSTYTLKSFFNKKVGVEVPYPGIGNSREKGKEDMSDRKIYKYYQWVCFCLFFQAMLFYAPRWLWKSWEGGKIRALMMDLDVGVCTEIEKKTKKKLILDYLWENLRYHNWWAYRYYLCEGLALINVIGGANVPDEPVLRRGVHDLRAEGHRLYGVRPGGADRPHDLHIPENGKVHVIQQIRVVRRSGAARRALHPTAERSQREDLCVPLVLVRHSRTPHLYHAALPACHHLLAPNAGIYDAHAVSPSQARQRGHHSQEEQNGRLVPTVHTRRKFGLGDIQGYNARVCEQTESQLPTPHSRSSGCVTSDPRVGVPHVTDVVAA